MTSPIQNLIDNYQELHTFLISEEKISESIEINNHYRKILLLSCASYYESQITDIIREFVKRHSNDEKILIFVDNKAIQRQFHTLFDWESSNINKFLGLFGSEFKRKVSKDITDNNLQEYIKAFLTIGSERNKMVHDNFLEYKLDKTFEEIVELHNKAIRFIEYLKEAF